MEHRKTGNWTQYTGNRDGGYMPEECKDTKCYKHGGLKVRGGRISGRVVSTKARNTAIIERDSTKFYSKYYRRAKERTHVAAHLPGCMSVSVGDEVVLGETRKLSKTKAWTVLEVIGGAKS
jgi:ribosomal protein uS17